MLRHPLCILLAYFDPKQEERGCKYLLELCTREHPGICSWIICIAREVRGIADDFERLHCWMCFLTHTNCSLISQEKESSGLIIVFRSYFRCSAWRPSQDQDLSLAKKGASSKVLSLESLQDQFQCEEDY